MATSCPWPIRLYSSDGRERLIVGCKRRQCPVCGPKVWLPRVLAGLHTGLRSDGRDYLAILLTAPGGADAEVFNRGASGAWHRFTVALRKSYPGAAIDFWRVAEVQERGHVHFHVVVRGLRFLPIPRLRALAIAAGFGSWVGLRRPRDYPGGPRSLGWYFTKYLLKDYGARIQGITKLVTFSNGWRTGWSERRKSSGKWLYAGSVGSAWLPLIGWEVPPLRRVVPRPPGRPAWWRRSWQARRAGEALTEPLEWSDTSPLT